MGEVYRAKDSKLGRDVAIKVLPDEFAENEERLARFMREAKVLASLNHPNIASIYSLEQSDRTHYLVLVGAEVWNSRGRRRRRDKAWSRRADLNRRPADYEEAKKGHQRPRRGVIPFPYRRIG